MKEEYGSNPQAGGLPGHKAWDHMARKGGLAGLTSGLIRSTAAKGKESSSLGSCWDIEARISNLGHSSLVPSSQQSPMDITGPLRTSGPLNRTQISVLCLHLGALLAPEFLKIPSVFSESVFLL